MTEAAAARDFGRVLAAEGISNFGSMLSRLAIPWVATLLLAATPLQMGWLRVADVATRLLDDARELQVMTEGDQPYGDGLASVRIVQTLMRRAPRHAGGAPVAEGPALLPPRRAVEP